jgi:hypothetical protein
VFSRTGMVLLVMCSLALGGLSYAADRSLAEVRFVPATSADKNAGVWVDGQYLGSVKWLSGENKLMLLPGEHEIVVRQAWYKDHVEKLLLQPGEVREIQLQLVKDSKQPPQDATAEVKISASPGRAAVFVDGQFAGQVEEFNGMGRAMLMTPGEHRLHIALPGYLPFDTVLNVRPHQKLEIKTELAKGSITQAGSLVTPDK